MESAKRRALLVGCNYAGKSCELQGCLSDVKSMKDLLKIRFDFEESNIVVLTDKQGNLDESKSTGENIKDKLGAMARESAAQDILVFYFSGHGTKGKFIPDSDEEVEAIVPSDFNLITNHDFRAILNQTKGTFVVISDSCHSGGLIDKEEVQIRDMKFENDSAKDIPQAQGRKEKRIEPSQLFEIVQVDDIFGYIHANFQGHESVSFHEMREWLPKIAQDKGILISGCRSDEVSYDLNAGLNGDGKAHGAFTSALLCALQGDPKPLANKEIVERVRELILGKGYNQHPCLYCTTDNLNAMFLLQQHEALNLNKDTHDEIPTYPPSLGPKNINLGILDDIMGAAKAYFKECSPSTQENLKNWYRELGIDLNNKTKASKVYNVLSEKKGCDKVALSEFISQTMTWDTALGLDQVLALYYVSKSLVKFCRNCNMFVRGFYFACLSCFTAEEEEFNLCPKCFEDGKKCEKAGHTRFLDNQALLRLYHVSQLKATRAQIQEKPSPEKINKLLDAAETSFRLDAGLNESTKETTRYLDLSVGLVTDICSIM